MVERRTDQVIEASCVTTHQQMALQLDLRHDKVPARNTILVRQRGSSSQADQETYDRSRCTTASFSTEKARDNDDSSGLSAPRRMILLGARAGVLAESMYCCFLDDLDTGSTCEV